MRKIDWILTIFIILILAGGGSYYLIRQKNKEVSDLQNQLNATKDEVNTASSATSVTGTQTSSDPNAKANLNKAKEVVTKFLEAKQTRSLDNAKPYMTEDYYKSSNAEGFAGTSSPSMGRFELTSAKYIEAAGLYEVKAKVYSVLQQQEVGYSENSYMVLNSNGTFLVNETKEGEFIEN